MNKSNIKRPSMASLTISNDYINSFNKNGFVILKNFFNIEELNDFKQSLLYLIKNSLKKASEKYNEINGDDFNGLEFDDGIITLEKMDTKFIADIYDSIPNLPSFMRLTAKRELSQFVNNLFEKPDDSPLFTFTNRCRIDLPNNNRRSTKWHQEIFYTIPKSKFVQTWGPLIRNITKKNGAIEVCIGSHKEGIAKQSLSKDNFDPTPFTIDNEIIEKYEKTMIELNLGDIMIFSPKLFHKTGLNMSNHVRYTNIGMFHDVEFPTFRPPQPSFTYKESSPSEYYEEFFKTS